MATRTIAVHRSCTTPTCNRVLLSTREGERGLCSRCWFSQMPADTRKAVARLIISVVSRSTAAEQDAAAKDVIDKVKRDRTRPETTRPNTDLPPDPELDELDLPGPPARVLALMDTPLAPDEPPAQ